MGRGKDVTRLVKIDRSGGRLLKARKLCLKYVVMKKGKSERERKKKGGRGIYYNKTE